MHAVNLKKKKKWKVEDFIAILFIGKRVLTNLYLYHHASTCHGDQHLVELPFSRKWNELNPRDLHQIFDESGHRKYQTNKENFKDSKEKLQTSRSKSLARIVRFWDYAIGHDYRHNLVIMAKNEARKLNKITTCTRRTSTAGAGFW